MDELFKKIDQEKENRFKKQWTKLDKGSKLNRLLVFIKMQKIEHNLSDANENNLKTLLLQLHNANLLTKSSDIEYDIETALIIRISNLHYDEELNKYTFIKTDKKKTNKTPSSQNSNIERHFHRKKSNTSKTF